MRSGSPSAGGDRLPFGSSALRRCRVLIPVRRMTGQVSAPCQPEEPPGTTLVGDPEGDPMTATAPASSGTQFDEQPFMVAIERFQHALATAPMSAEPTALCSHLL